MQLTKFFYPFLDFPEILNINSRVKGNLVTVFWSSLANCDVKNYALRYKIAGERTEETKEVPVKENKHIIKLQCHKVYQIAVTAVTVVGGTRLTSSRWWEVKTGQGNYKWPSNVLLYHLKFLKFLDCFLSILSSS